MSPMTKHVLENPQELVKRSLQGLVYANAKLELDLRYKIVYLKELDQRVHLLSGGGSGHEPAHAGFVGRGMLSAAVCGDIFASPNAKQVEAAINACDTGNGVLLIVKNYTGDVLQFGLAKERHLAGKSTPIRMIVVGDDVAVGRSQGQLVGRRGLAGTVLVYKLAGALAARGASFDECTAFAMWACQHVATIGVGFDHCHVPSQSYGAHEGNLAADEVAIGLGIHNEPGFTTAKMAGSALPTLMTTLLEALLSVDDEDRSYLKDAIKLDGQDRVVLLVNALGGISNLELNAAAREAGEQIASSRWKIIVERVMVGTFMTSLNMPGFSLSILVLPRDGDPDLVQPEPGAEEVPISLERVLELLSEDCSDVPAWTRVATDCPGDSDAGAATCNAPQSDRGNFSAENRSATCAQLRPTNEATFVAAIRGACRSVMKAERQLTEYDSVAGDGDCGTTLRSGAEALLNLVDSSEFPLGDVAAASLTIADTLASAMGGTSGGLWSIFFSALSSSLRTHQERTDPSLANASLWASSLEAALNRLYDYTGARPPSRTLVDPLSAFVLTFAKDPNDLHKAIAAAEEAAEATRFQVASAGRAAYVDRKQLNQAQEPDAGAWGVRCALQGLGEALTH